MKATKLKLKDDKSFIRRAMPYVLVTAATVLLLIFFLLATRVI